jgi:hypothetical protein
MSQGNDMIGLLHLIRSGMYGGATNKYLERTIIDAQMKLLTLRQSSRMSNAEYLRLFCGLVDALDTLVEKMGSRCPGSPCIFKKDNKTLTIVISGQQQKQPCASNFGCDVHHQE